MRMGIAALAVAALTPLCAQDMRLPANIDALAAKAEDSVDVTLDGSMLRLAAKWLHDTGEDAKAKKVLSSLEGIYIRSYHFASEGEYTKADVETFRSQFRAPGWSRLVGARSKRSGGDADVFVKTDANGNLGGLVVVAAEPRELTVVNIVGTIDPAQLADLGGRFHLPALDLTDCNMCRREWK